jgi:membrane protease YdiL (CAAX protease family)
VDSPGSPSRRAQLLELGAFLFLIVPSLALSFFVIRQGQTSFTITAVATILRDLSLVAIILYFLWRNGEPPAAVGWTVRKPFLEVVIGVALFPAMFFGTGWLDGLLARFGFSSPSTSLPSLVPAGNAGQASLAVALVAVVALSEETIFRGYLMLRFRGLTGSPVAAVLLSAVIFSLGHGYEGSAGVITVGGMGVALAVVYAWRRSLIAPVVMHFLQDLLAIVILPLLSRGAQGSG